MNDTRKSAARHSEGYEEDQHHYELQFESCVSAVTFLSWAHSWRKATPV